MGSGASSFGLSEHTRAQLEMLLYDSEETVAESAVISLRAQRPGIVLFDCLARADPDGLVRSSELKALLLSLPRNKPLPDTTRSFIPIEGLVARLPLPGKFISLENWLEILDSEPAIKTAVKSSVDAISSRVKRHMLAEERASWLEGLAAGAGVAGSAPWDRLPPACRPEAGGLDASRALFKRQQVDNLIVASTTLIDRVACLG